MATIDVTGVKTGLKALLNDNSSTILSGITHQGQARRFAQVTRTILTNVEDTYFVLVNVPRSLTRSINSDAPRRQPASEAIYFVQLRLADIAEIQSGDVEAYETMALDFSTVYGRIVNLIKATNFITSDPCTILARGTGASDRLVTTVDLSQPERDANSNLWAKLYVQIQFQLVDNTVS